MPVQKGKRNKHRPRARHRMTNEMTATTVRAGSAASSQTNRPVRRTRSLWQGPPWFNAALGVFMLVAGTAFFVLPQRGVSTRDRALLLAAYVGLAGFYLFRAFRGYRAQATR